MDLLYSVVIIFLIVSNIDSYHLNRRYICGHCQKSYIRNIDFLKHRVNCHQPLILKQHSHSVDTTTIKPKEDTHPKFDIGTTTAFLEGKTNLEDILKKDSSSDQ